MSVIFGACSAEGRFDENNRTAAVNVSDEVALLEEQKNAKDISGQETVKLLTGGQHPSCWGLASFSTLMGGPEHSG